MSPVPPLYCKLERERGGRGEGSTFYPIREEEEAELIKTSANRRQQGACFSQPRLKSDSDSFSSKLVAGSSCSGRSHPGRTFPSPSSLTSSWRHTRRRWGGHLGRFICYSIISRGGALLMKLPRQNGTHVIFIFQFRRHQQDAGECR